MRLSLLLLALGGAASVAGQCIYYPKVRPGPPSTLLCGLQGRTNNPAQVKYLTNIPSLEACAGECWTYGTGCLAFSANTTRKTCRLFSKTLRGNGFSVVNPDGQIFNDRDCYAQNCDARPDLGPTCLKAATPLTRVNASTGLALDTCGRGYGFDAGYYSGTFTGQATNPSKGFCALDLDGPDASAGFTYSWQTSGEILWRLPGLNSQLIPATDTDLVFIKGTRDAQYLDILGTAPNRIVRFETFLTKNGTANRAHWIVTIPEATPWIVNVSYGTTSYLDPNNFPNPGFVIDGVSQSWSNAEGITVGKGLRLQYDLTKKTATGVRPVVALQDRYFCPY